MNQENTSSKNTDYLPSIKHGQFDATPKHEREHNLYCPCTMDYYVTVEEEEELGEDV